VRLAVKSLGGVLVLAAATIGGVAVGRLVLDKDETISDAEHDRLVDACSAATDDPVQCVAWIAELIEERPDASYSDLAAYMLERQVEEEERAAEDEERAEAADRARQETQLRDLEDFLDEQAAQDCTERHGGPCDEATTIRDEMAELDCVRDNSPDFPTVTGEVVRACLQALDDGLALPPRACRENPTGAIAVADYGDLIEVPAGGVTVPCSGPLP
jgi:hypothetical protein